jgi:two-component system sensor histidine kinase BaeS
MRRRRGPWRGFGCLFGLVFVVGLVGLVSFVTSVVVAAGPVGHVARILGLALLLAGIVTLVTAGRTVRHTATTLDDLVDATARVESGDYTTRVAVPERARGPIRQLARGFNAMTSRLESDEQQRRRLLADVSHELRTPLAVVQGNIEAMIDGVHPADEAHLAAILDETRVLGRLVDDLRTVTLSEAGALPLHREPTDLAILIEDAVASFRPTAEAAGVLLAVDVAEDLPLADVDPVRIREVIVNLVANALRHTPSGGSVRVESRPAGEGRLVVVSVTDTGTGIAPDLLEHVFDRFARSADSGGSGLGLAIARGLVEAHGGTISATSEPGRGSMFRFEVPVSADTPPP